MSISKHCLFTVVFALLGFASYSCKKCITCSSICYNCIYPVAYQGKTSGILCSDEVGSLDSFNAVLYTLVHSRGDSCYRISPEKSYKYCESNKDFINAVGNVGFNCK